MTESVASALFPYDTFEFIRPDEFIELDGDVRRYLNYWWALDEEGRIALWNPIGGRKGGRYLERGKGVPQCNAEFRVAEKMLDPQSVYYGPWVKRIVRIPEVILPPKAD